MPTQRRQMDLAGRRRDLGASVKAMAHGLGLTVAEVVAIESGAVADAKAERYLAWLSRIENWSAGKRERELRAAETDGRRFT